MRGLPGQMISGSGGPQYQATLASFGWPTTSLHCVGFPHDVLSSPANISNAAIPSVSRPIIRSCLLLANANLGICSVIARPADEMRLIAEIIRAVSLRSSAVPLRLLVRCYPATISTRYGHALAQLCSTAANVDFDDAGVTLAQPIREVDMVFGSSSTGLIEAARAGKPVVVLAPSGLDITGFTRYSVPTVGPSDDIAARIDAIMHDGAGLSRAREQLFTHAAPDLDLLSMQAMIDVWMSVSKEDCANSAFVQS